jgi:hypothetical protein
MPNYRAKLAFRTPFERTVADLRVGDDEAHLHDVADGHLTLDAWEDRFQIELSLGDLRGHELEAALEQGGERHLHETGVIEEAVFP